MQRMKSPRSKTITLISQGGTERLIKIFRVWGGYLNAMDFECNIVAPRIPNLSNLID